MGDEFADEIEGKNILLRVPREEDDLKTSEIYSDKKSMQHLLNLLTNVNGWSVEEMKKRREDILKRKKEKACCMYNIFIRGEETNQFDTQVGVSGFRIVDMRNRSAEGGIIVHHPYWRKGICLEAHYLCFQYAFETLKLHRVFFLTLESNEPMRGFYHKFGIKQDGTHRDAIFNNFRGPNDPEYYSTCSYSVLESEWEEMKGKMLDCMNRNKE